MEPSDAYGSYGSTGIISHPLITLAQTRGTVRVPASLDAVAYIAKPLSGAPL